MKRCADSDEEDEIFNYGNKRLLTFSHDQVVLNFSSSEDEGEVETESEPEPDNISDSEENNIRIPARLNDSLLSPSPPPPPPNSTKFPLQKSSEVLQRLKNGCVTLSHSPDSQDLVLTKKSESDVCKVKVRVHGQVKKFTIKKNEPFLSLYQRIAEEENVSIARVVLNKKLVTIDTNDTVQKLNITICDIIECLIFDDDEEGNKITVRVQSELKSSRVDFKISPVEKLLVILNRYCEMNNACFEKARFSFDGEEIDATQTAAALDIEDGDVIDVMLNKNYELFAS